MAFVSPLRFVFKSWSLIFVTFYVLLGNHEVLCHVNCHLADSHTDIILQ